MLNPAHCRFIFNPQHTRLKRLRMKRLLLLIAVSLLCATTLSVAGKIYKWTDSEGNIHYGERPPSEQAKQIKIPKGPSSTSAPVSTPSNQQEATKKLLNAFDKERKDKADASAKAAKEKALRDKNCSISRKRVASYSIGGRIYDITEQGERRYLEEDEIKKGLAEAQKDVEKWCK